MLVNSRAEVLPWQNPSLACGPCAQLGVQRLLLDEERAIPLEEDVGHQLLPHDVIRALLLLQVVDPLDRLADDVLQRPLCRVRLFGLLSGGLGTKNGPSPAGDIAYDVAGVSLTELAFEQKMHSFVQ